MTEVPSVFNSWVPNWLKIPLLILGMLPHLLLIGLFSGNATFIASVIDADVNDLQFIMAVGYGAIVVTLLVNARLFMFMALRNYIIVVVTCSITILLSFLLVKNYIIISTLRVLEGFFAILQGVIFFPVIMSLIKSKHARAISYFILYALMLSSGPLTAWTLKIITLNFGWDHIFYFLAIFHCSILIITLFLFNGNYFFPKKNLANIDWSSCLYLLICFVSGVFLILYGFRLNWFHSPYIWYSLFISLISLGLFIFRQSTQENPIFFLEIFKNKNVQLSLVLFASFYFIRFGYNNIYTTMITVWKWPWENVVNFQFYNVFGVLIGVLLSAYFILKAYPSKIVFALGFLILTFNSYYISTLFDSDVSTFALLKAVTIQGIAYGLLFTPLVMYIVNAVPPEHVNNATMAATGVRFWITNSGFALAQNLTYMFQEKNFDTLKTNFDATKPIVSDEFDSKLAGYEQTFDTGTAELLTQNDFANQLYQQANLVANKELFMFYFWLAFITFIALVLSIVYSRFKNQIAK